MTPPALEMTNQPTRAINFRKPTWWKRTTNSEWNLIAIAGVMLLASSFIAPALATPHSNHSGSTESLPPSSAGDNGLTENQLGRYLIKNGELEEARTLCITPGCVKAAATVINNMDLSVDPCDDFYKFACGKYTRDGAIEDENKRQVIAFGVMKTLYKNLRVILAEPVQPADEQKLIKMVKALYKSCMDTEKIEKDGLGPFKETLKSLGGWPVLEGEKWNDAEFTWKDSVYKLKEKGHVNYFIQLSVDDYFSNKTLRSNYGLSLNPPTLTINRKNLVQDTNKTVDSYYRLMVDIAVLLGADRQMATKDLRDLLDFEIRLAEISEEEVFGDKVNSVEMKLASLQQTFPSIPWQEYLNKLLNPQTIGQDDYITVTSPKYLSGLEALLSSTPKRVQANYVIWAVVQNSIKYLTEELSEREFEMKRFSNLLEREPRSMRCANIVIESFPLATGSMYVRRMFGENDKKNVIEMANNIREEMYKILSSVDWMDDGTRENALEKLKLMTMSIAYPDEFLDEKILNAFYENLELDDKDYFYISKLNINKFNTDNEISKLRQPVNKTDWKSHLSTLTTNAFYNPYINEIIVECGILLGAYFSSDRPRYMNYGAIGTVIGHEFTHAFDTTGSLYDKKGNYVDWWDQKTKKQFMEKVECIISQYGNYTEDGLKLNGNSTKDENISDNGGFRAAYHAYNAWAKQHDVEPQLPGLVDYTPQQMFWLSSANIWCSYIPRLELEYRINSTSHTIDRYRVIGTFSNLEEFSDDFRCPLGSNMNPVNKCKVW